MTSGKKPRGPRSQCPKQHKARRRIAEEDSCLPRSSEKRNLSELVVPRLNVSSPRSNPSSRVRMCHPQSESVSPSEDLAFGPGQVVVPCALRKRRTGDLEKGTSSLRRKDEKIIQASQNETGWENIDGPVQFRRSLIGHSGQINSGERGISPFIRKVSRDPNYQKR
jgi:hypothetical protein